MAFTVNKSPDFISAVRNPVPVQIQADAGWKGIDDYHFKLVIQYEPDYKSATLEPLCTLGPITPDPDGKVLVNLEAVLESIVEHEPPTWPSLYHFPWKGEKLPRRYSLSIQEWEEGKLSDARHYPFRQALGAGMGHLSTLSLSGWVAQKRFLTHQPRIKKVTKQQPEWLYLTVPGGLSLTGVTAKISPVVGGGLPTANLIVDTIPATSYDVIAFPVGYNMLGMSSIGEVESWKVSFQAVGGAADGKQISEEMEYVLDCDCTENDRYFIFENSLGGYDTVRLTGVAASSFVTKGESARKVVSPIDWRTRRDVANFGTTHRYEAEQASGYFDKEEQAWLTDLLRSDDAYRIGNADPQVNAAGELIPIVINRGESKFRSDDDMTYKFEFKYQEALTYTGI